MSDRIKVWLAIVGFLAALVLPVVALALGWASRDFKTGAIAGGLVFLVLFGVAIWFSLSIARPSLVNAALPFLFSAVYAVVPDVLLGPVDDAAVVTVGGLITAFQWYRSRKNTSGWAVVPFILAGAYTLVGGPILGPLGEIIVYLVSGGVATYIASRSDPLPAEDTRPAARNPGDRDGALDP